MNSAACPPATEAAHDRPDKPRLRVVSNERGCVVRVFVGELDITHLCARAQSVTEGAHTRHEIVLFGWDSARRDTAITRTTGATTQ